MCTLFSNCRVDTPWTWIFWLYKNNDKYMMLVLFNETKKEKEKEFEVNLPNI